MPHLRAGGRGRRLQGVIVLLVLTMTERMCPEQGNVTSQKVYSRRVKAVGEDRRLRGEERGWLNVDDVVDLDSAESAAERALAREELQVLIAGLQKDIQIVFKLYHEDGLGLQEIADRLGMRPEIVRLRLLKAEHAFRAKAEGRNLSPTDFEPPGLDWVASVREGDVGEEQRSKPV